MKSHTIFLRTGCILPDGLNLVQEPFSETWMSVEGTTSIVLDEKIRAVGWHFIWLAETCSCSSVGKMATSAIDKAIAGALKRIQQRFNAAELDSIKISKYPGFKVVRVNIHARHIQQHPSFSLRDELKVPQLVVR